MASAALRRRSDQIWLDVGQTIGGGPLARHVATVVVEQWAKSGLDCVCLGPDEIAFAEALRQSLACPIVCSNFRHEGVAAYWDCRGLRVSSVVEARPGSGTTTEPCIPALDSLFTGAAAAGLLPVVALHAEGATRLSVLAWLRSVSRRFIIFDVGSKEASERGVARYGGGMIIRFAGQGRSFADVDWDLQDPHYWARFTLLDAKKGNSTSVASRFQEIVARDVEVDGGHRTSYIGSSACRECHFAEYDTWSRTRHAAAIRSLDAARMGLRPDCYVCHVTSAATLPGAHGGGLPTRHEPLDCVGCESCHGPGQQHRDSRAKTIVEPAATCAMCHVGKFSSTFGYRDSIAKATCQSGSKQR
ncbi:MAG: cytochrome c family protein [Planctomycetota bacterium]